MSLLGKIFSRKKRCVLCNVEILDPHENEEYKMLKKQGLARLGDRFGDPRYVLMSLQEPFMVCNHCGAIVCRSHLNTSTNPHPWPKFPLCPKCNSEMEYRGVY